VRRENSVDDVLDLIRIKHKISIQDIQDILSLDIGTIKMILDFLARFDFVNLQGRSVLFSKTCKPFFEEMLPVRFTSSP